MEAALAEAQAALEAGNLPIGAVIVHEDQVVASGRNAIDVPADDTRHAELVAIESIAPFLAQHKHECVLYTTLEPCMMCLGAIINVGIDTVIVARPDPDIGGFQLLPHGEYYNFKRGRMNVVSGFMAAESQALLSEYVRRTGIRTHLAQSAA
jgi:tRNA(adenine34) deaminase